MESTFIVDDIKITMSDTELEELKSVQEKYIDCLVKNIQERFPDNDILEALAIFNPLSIPACENEGFENYGTDYVKKLGTHFFSEKNKQDQLLSEWSHFKYYVNDNVEVPDTVRDGESQETPTSWFLNYLMKNKCTYKPFFQFATLTCRSSHHPTCFKFLT